MNKTKEEMEGAITQAITEFGLSLGDVISTVVAEGNEDHKQALKKIFSDALNETNRLLEK